VFALLGNYHLSIVFQFRGNGQRNFLLEIEWVDGLADDD